MSQKVLVILLAVLCSISLSCGDDDDDSAGGSGGTAVDSGDGAGAGGSGGTAVDSGDGVRARDSAGEAAPDVGSDPDLLAVCMEKTTGLPAAPEECDSCACENCSQQFADCSDDQGCASIYSCVREKACTSQSDCYMPDTCQDVIDEVLGSSSTAMLNELRQCTESAACPCPWISDPDAAGTFTISGSVVEFMTWQEVATTTENTEISGVEVCVLENQELCTTTVADGTYTLQGAPANTEFYLAFFKQGYRSEIRCVTRRTDDMDLGAVMKPDAMVESDAVAIGSSYPDETTGSLELYSIKQNTEQSDSIYVTRDGNWATVEGTTFNVQPESGIGPFYANPDAEYDTSLSEASQGGFGSFFELEPGEYTVSVSHPTLDCILVGSPAQPAPEKVKIAAGYCTTGLGALCL